MNKSHAIYAVIVGVTLMSLMSVAGCQWGGEEGLGQVNGRTIGEEEFKAYMAHKRLPLQNKDRTIAALDQYLEREALAEVIEEQNVLDASAIQVEINEFRKEMLISRYFDDFLKDKVTADALLNYYNQNADEFQEKRIHVAHVLIRTDRNMDEATRRAKLTTAQEVYSKLKADEDFAELASNYSEDKISGKKGGDLGWVQAGAIGEVFSKRAFELKEAGEFTEPFETPFGFHIVKLLEAEKVIKKPFEAVKGDIRYQLRNRAKTEELARLLGETSYEKNIAADLLRE